MSKQQFTGFHLGQNWTSSLSSSGYLREFVQLVGETFSHVPQGILWAGLQEYVVWSI